jgi:hypothetical protein
LTIKSLAFKSHDFNTIIGTISQGYFSSIELGADFYSGGVVIEIPGERIRMTDLEWVTPNMQQVDNNLIITANISINDCTISKKIILDTKSERIKLSYDLPGWERPLGTVRLGIVIFLPEWDSSHFNVYCKNGGVNTETFQLDHVVNHSQAASTLVSSTAALGATDGRVTIKNSSGHGISLDWNSADCAATPMLQHQISHNHYLTRILFSLCELDDTSRAGGVLEPFSFDISSA